VQDLSFDFNDPVWEFGGLRFAMQVFTFENVYGLDPAACTLAADGERLVVECGGLTWAGGQELAEGGARIMAQAGPSTTTFTMEAWAGERIRCVKLVLKGMPDGEIVNLRETEARHIPPEGLRLVYPSGWRELHTPLAIMCVGEGEHIWLRSLDRRVREKRFTWLRRDDALDIELIFEENATEMGNHVVVPAWEVGSSATPEAVIETHQVHVERAYGLLPWEERPDVPGWGREISLLAAIHCRHWTGYVFNDYTRVLATIRWLAERIEGRRILAYLCGWEGRYYWQYGVYRPDPRMGGEKGFARLVDGARELGVQIMAMFGANYANKGLPNYEQWGAPAEVLSAGGNRRGGSVDWDGARHYDHGSGALLNPGSPTWQNHLVSQIHALVDRYGFNGVYLDISAMWLNDPRYDVHRGTLELIRRIREGHPDIMIGGEGWYDAIGAATPLVMSGHTNDTLHWHDQPYPRLFDPYHRSFAHLVIGDPSRGSTGVHELGSSRTRRVPVRRGVLPTVAIVDGTIERAPDAVAAIVEDAHLYARQYLGA